MRNASCLALVFSVVLFAGCGKQQMADPNPQADTFKDSQYYQSLRGLSATSAFAGFLSGLDPSDRAKYINKCVEEEPPPRLLGLKSVFEKFASDPSPEVATAAKDALAKVPTQEQVDAYNKEELEKLKK